MRRTPSATAVTARTAALVLLALAVLPARAAAQGAQNRIDFEARAGLALPAFDLADRADPGLGIGLDLGYRLSERVLVLVGGDVEFLEGAPVGSSLSLPGLTVWHYGLGLETRLLDPHTTYWRLSTGAGLGGSTYDAEGGGTRTALSLYGSLELGYEVSAEAELFVGVRSWLGFVDEEASTIAGPPDPSDPLVGVGSTAWSFPVSGGIRFRF